MADYELAPAYAGVQFWNADHSDLVEVRRQPGMGSNSIPSDIPAAEAKRLLGMGAIVEAGQTPQAPSVGAPEEPAGNASRDEWASYADALGLTFDPGAGREQIKQAIDESRR